MKLVHNSPISIKSDFKVDKNKDQVDNLRDLKRNKERTQKPERVYFLWFLNLKLLLEMEELKLGLQKPKTDKKFIIGKDIKIDKKFYKKWDLEEVLNVTHYKWWKTHQTLFESPPIVERDNLEGWTSKDHYRYLRVDLRNS